MKNTRQTKIDELKASNAELEFGDLAFDDYTNGGTQPSSRSASFIDDNFPVPVAYDLMSDEDKKLYKPIVEKGSKKLAELGYVVGWKSLSDLGTNNKVKNTEPYAGVYFRVAYGLMFIDLCEKNEVNFIDIAKVVCNEVGRDPENPIDTGTLFRQSKIHIDRQKASESGDSIVRYDAKDPSVLADFYKQGIVKHIKGEKKHGEWDTRPEIPSVPSLSDLRVSEYDIDSGNHIDSVMEVSQKKILMRDGFTEANVDAFLEAVDTYIKNNKHLLNAQIDAFDDDSFVKREINKIDTPQDLNCLSEVQNERYEKAKRRVRFLLTEALRRDDVAEMILSPTINMWRYTKDLPLRTLHRILTRWYEKNDNAVPIDDFINESLFMQEAIADKCVKVDITTGKYEAGFCDYKVKGKNTNENAEFRNKVLAERNLMITNIRNDILPNEIKTRDVLIDHCKRALITYKLNGLIVSVDSSMSVELLEGKLKEIGGEVKQFDGAVEKRERGVEALGELPESERVRYIQRAENKYICPTPFRSLDNIIKHRGNWRGGMILVAAPTAGGKTFLAQQWTHTAASHGCSVLHLTLETSEEDIYERIVQYVGSYADNGIELPLYHKELGVIQDIETGGHLVTRKMTNTPEMNLEKLAVIENYGKLLHPDAKIVFRDLVEEQKTTANVRLIVEQFKDTHGHYPDVIVCDGLNELEPSDTQKRSQGWEETSKMVIDFHDLCVNVNACGVITSQLNRGGNTSARDGSGSDLNSTSLSFVAAQKAQLVLHINSTEEEEAFGMSRIKVLKNRVGQRTMEFMFINNHARGIPVVRNSDIVLPFKGKSGDTMETHLAARFTGGNK